MVRDLLLNRSHSYLRQLASLRVRSDLEYFLIGARRNAYTPATVAPIVCVSEMGAEFITHYLKLDAATLAQHFGAYTVNHGGIPGDVSTPNGANGLRGSCILYRNHTRSDI